LLSKAILRTLGLSGSHATREFVLPAYRISTKIRTVLIYRLINFNDDLNLHELLLCAPHNDQKSTVDQIHTLFLFGRVVLVDSKGERRMVKQDQLTPTRHEGK